MTAVKTCLPPVGETRRLSLFLMRLLMGVWEAECHLPFEIKGPRCVFPQLMMKPFPSLSLVPPQQDWCDVRGPLHCWPPEKKGLPVGCGLAEKGEPSGVDSRKACCCPPGGRSGRPDVGERGPQGTVVGAAGVLGSNQRRGGSGRS